jgi:hypothetical protein
MENVSWEGTPCLSFRKRLRNLSFARPNSAISDWGSVWGNGGIGNCNTTLTVAEHTCPISCSCSRQTIMQTFPDALSVVATLQPPALRQHRLEKMPERQRPCPS